MKDIMISTRIGKRRKIKRLTIEALINTINTTKAEANPIIKFEVGRQAYISLREIFEDSAKPQRETTAIKYIWGIPIVMEEALPPNKIRFVRKEEKLGCGEWVGQSRKIAIKARGHH